DARNVQVRAARVCECHGLSRARRADTLVPKRKAGGREAHGNPGARQRNCLGTVGGIVIEGYGASSRPCCGRREHDGDRATLSRRDGTAYGWAGPPSPKAKSPLMPKAPVILSAALPVLVSVTDSTALVVPSV